LRFAPWICRRPKRTKGGEVRIVDSSTFKGLTTVAMAMVTVRPGGLRELHWHPNADEWQYYISGKGRMTVVATGNRARTLDFQAGDVGYVEKTLLHYIENTGDTDLVFLEMFKSSHYQDMSLLGVVGAHAAGTGHGASAH
jgi:oxalate decarboxylase